MEIQNPLLIETDTSRLGVFALEIFPR